ncbi:hypothetical protein BZL29_8176 [Mycobacterium kansasii]|uniref:Uncharacterized protein n=1 Tax=Mycobacterium kansasii TaxID=1768 RepID=A0A1V3WBP7_MYCKA|nr:hypothetical protein BZL29_8176 [Mycobacterium kansasii]
MTPASATRTCWRPAAFGFDADSTTPGRDNGSAPAISLFAVAESASSPIPAFRRPDRVSARQACQPTGETGSAILSNQLWTLLENWLKDQSCD